MAYVFVSGSRRVKDLPEAAKTLLDKIMTLGFIVLVGDCYGVDVLVQRYLKSKNYQHVQVYHIGDRARHNAGFQNVRVRGARQTDKDKRLFWN